MKNPGEWGIKLDSGNLLGWGIFPGECRNEQIFSLQGKNLSLRKSTRKTCNKYFQSLQVAKTENVDKGFSVKNFIQIYNLLKGNIEWKAK